MSRWTAPSTITGLLVVLSSLISGCSHSERDAAGFWASESVVLRISREGENGEHYTVEWKEFLRGSRGSFTGLYRDGKIENSMVGDLTRPSQFEGLTGAKPFRISEGYPRVFTTEKGGRRPILAGSGRP